MLGNEGQAASAVTLLSAVSAANTAAATSAWVDVRDREGDLVIVVNTGAITGSCTLSVEHASDGSGTGAAAITPNEGAPAVINSANQIRKFTVPAGAVAGFVRIIGTIVTGPVLISATLLARPKQT